MNISTLLGASTQKNIANFRKTGVLRIIWNIKLWAHGKVSVFLKSIVNFDWTNKGTVGFLPRGVAKCKAFQYHINYMEWNLSTKNPAVDCERVEKFFQKIISAKKLCSCSNRLTHGQLTRRCRRIENQHSTCFVA